jgi:hypothetical protein
VLEHNTKCWIYLFIAQPEDPWLVPSLASTALVCCLKTRSNYFGSRPSYRHFRRVVNERFMPGFMWALYSPLRSASCSVFLSPPKGIQKQNG